MQENSKELQKVRKWTRLDMEIQRLHGSRVSKGMSLVWVGWARHACAVAWAPKMAHGRSVPPSTLTVRVSSPLFLSVAALQISTMNSSSRRCLGLEDVFDFT